MTMLLVEALLVLVLFILFAYLVALFLEFVRLHRGGVPFVPSTTAILRAVIDANVLPHDGLILDLGCGDGKALRMLAHAGYKGPLVGYERAFYPWLHSKLWGILDRSPVIVRREDFSHAPLEEARGVYVFLLASVLSKLAPTLSLRLAPGTVVVSAEFPIADWTPVQVLTAPGVTAREAKVFVYVVSGSRGSFQDVG
ncbi:MAG TPA: class I SAM-dependent methyltransferase [Candidatus Methylomirabilis sp.]|nr:class I SAM-dependent methyltransferase [Candidatus Methylomirabilis sp.]